MDTYKGLYVSEPVKIRLTSDPLRPGMKAWATVVLNDAYCIHGIRVVDVGARTIVAFPSKQLHDGRFVDVIHPICEPARRWLERYILEAYLDESHRRSDWDAKLAAVAAVSSGDLREAC